MGLLSVKIQYLPEPKRIKYTKFIVNIITHLSVLSRIIKNEIENMDIDIPETDLKSDVEINYIVDKNNLLSRFSCIPSSGSASESGSDIRSSGL